MDEAVDGYFRCSIDVSKGHLQSEELQHAAGYFIARQLRIWLQTLASGS